MHVLQRGGFRQTRRMARPVPQGSMCQVFPMQCWSIDAVSYLRWSARCRGSGAQDAGSTVHTLADPLLFADAFRQLRTENRGGALNDFRREEGCTGNGR